MDEPVIVQVPAERRQIAQTFTFPKALVPYIARDAIAKRARGLGADFDVRTQADGGITVTLSWPFDPEDI